ncbi:hypothetical protein AOQ71_36310 [Bradyrhizobium manausense]|uniref:Uncharacterized protein n=1 Tax=Bradyrhizobium manausense TaxID=989370 RepID=A0A0R3CWU8_9BRAD|nr:hypothetical protein AOQ71_36310 [Bradyrhizobium manausense]
MMDEWPHTLPSTRKQSGMILAAVEAALMDRLLGPDEGLGSVVVCVDVGIDVVLKLLEACEGGAAGSLPCRIENDTSTWLSQNALVDVNETSRCGGPSVIAHSSDARISAEPPLASRLH